MEENNKQQQRPRTARELRKAKEAEEKKRKEAEEKLQRMADGTAESSLDEDDTAPEQPVQEDTAPFTTLSEEELHRVSTENGTSMGEETAEAQETPTSEAKEAADPSLAALKETLDKEVENWKQQAEENETLLLKARADFENFRRRARKDQEDSIKYGATSLMESLLPVLDNLERALEATGDTEENDPLRQGVEMVHRQLLQSLTEKGLAVIEAVGLEFNPHEHTAVMQEEADGVQAGIVLQEMQKGYRFKERVLRPAMVKVSS